MGRRLKLSDRALQQHLRSFRIGDVRQARGLASGYPDLIFELETTRGRFLLRISHDRSMQEALFEEALLHHLAAANLPVPKMLTAAKHGAVVPVGPKQQLSVFELRVGRQIGVFEVTAAHAEQVGQFLAALHRAVQGFRRVRRGRNSVGALARLLERCAKSARISEHARDARALAVELVRHMSGRTLPRGLVHGELTVEQSRFCAGRLCGVLRFDAAATGPLAGDVAAALADWAFQRDEFVAPTARALVAGYQSVRPLLPEERGALFDLTCLALVRVAVHRLHQYEVGKSAGESRIYKDYRHAMRRLTTLQRIGPQRFRDAVFARGT